MCMSILYTCISTIVQLLVKCVDTLPTVLECACIQCYFGRQFSK